MFELVNSYIDSLALFLAILFIQGMSFRKIRQYRPNWFQNGGRRLFLSILLGVYYGLAGIYFIYEGAYENNPVIYEYADFDFDGNKCFRWPRSTHFRLFSNAFWSD